MARLNYDSHKAPVWQLPVTKAERRGDGYISKNQKYHCFVDNTSLCKYHNQRTTDYDDGITVESGVILSAPHFACQKCYARWKRIYQVR